MIKVKTNKKLTQMGQYLILLTSLLFLFTFTQAVFAQGIFEDKKKSQHKLSGGELNRIKAEHQLKFGKVDNASSSPYKSNNPWDKKKKAAKKPVKTATWGECRDYALHKRNRCYREGRDAYNCERAYETRSKLCDTSL